MRYTAGRAIWRVRRVVAVAGIPGIVVGAVMMEVGCEALYPSPIEWSCDIGGRVLAGRLA